MKRAGPVVKVKGAYEPRGPSGRRLSPVSVASSDASPLQGSINSPGPIYTPGRRDAMRVKCLRPSTRTTRSGDEWITGWSGRINKAKLQLHRLGFRMWPLVVLGWYKKVA